MLLDKNINKMNFKLATTLLAIVFLAFACSSDNSTKHDLMKHGIPLTIYGPDSIDVKKEAFGSIIENYTIKGNNFSVELNVSNAETKDPTQLKKSYKSLIQGEAYFDKIVNEDENGFLYAKKIDSTLTTYNFRLVKVVGDKEYVFQPGMAESLTQTEAQQMFDWLKGPKS